MRFPLIALCLATCALTHADRFILAPLGKKVPFGAIKVEHMLLGGDDAKYTDRFGFGITTFFDGEIVSDRMDGRSTQTSLDLSFNYTDPIVDLVPGVSIGVQDVANRTPDGRRFYWVTTYYLGLDGAYNQNTPMEFTLGYTAGSRTGAVIAVSLPMASWFRLLSEFDTGRITHGLEYRPAKQATVKMLFRKSDVFWTLGWTLRF